MYKCTDTWSEVRKWGHPALSAVVPRLHFFFSNVLRLSVGPSAPESPPVTAQEEHLSPHSTASSWWGVSVALSALSLHCPAQAWLPVGPQWGTEKKSPAEDIPWMMTNTGRLNSREGQHPRASHVLCPPPPQGTGAFASVWLPPALPCCQLTSPQLPACPAGKTRCLSACASGSLLGYFYS